jgi:hypothetical protein
VSTLAKGLTGGFCAPNGLVTGDLFSKIIEDGAVDTLSVFSLFPKLKEIGASDFLNSNLGVELSPKTRGLLTPEPKGFLGS